MAALLGQIFGYHFLSWPKYEPDSGNAWWG